jgi:SEC-C motif-containing protein
MICPCQLQTQSLKQYTECCKPLHKGQAALNPEQLMRSRFSGFVLGLTDYINKSWHSSTRPHDLSLNPDEQWLKLEIIKSTSRQVHFKAYFRDADSPQGFSVLEELSDFIKKNGNWYYVSGDTQIQPTNLTRNDVCLCGSGKKYKKCCAL